MTCLLGNTRDATGRWVYRFKLVARETVKPAKSCFNCKGSKKRSDHRNLSKNFIYNLCAHMADDDDTSDINKLEQKM